MRRSLLTLLCAAAVLLMLPAAAQAITFDQAVDQLFRQGYPQRLEKTIAGFKSTPLGFRWTGSPADNQAAQFLADEMVAAGLTNVKLEPVPVDAWSIESSSVTVGGKVMDASSYPGVPATGADGVTGEVVRIPNYASAADFDKVGDLTGKIALIGFASDYWWMNFPCAEAALRGAKAVILIYDKRYPGYQAAPNAFASNDPGYTYTSPPLVWLPADSASWLEKQMKKAPVTATVTLRSSHTFAEDGGVGYNVIGELPGSSADGTKVVFGGHHDSHFTGALDNDTSCVAQLVIAKAMQMSGYKPASTMVFFNTTAEEWGYTDCNYDWLVGSVYSIQHTHPDWAGKVKAMLNLELLGYKKGSTWFTATRELKPWLKAEMKKHPKLVGPKGGKVYTQSQSLWFSYNDQWALTATGIPSACMWTPDEYFWSHYYHTNYDALNMLDWGFFKKNIKLNGVLARSVDRSLLPYDLSTQADALLAASTDVGFQAADIDASTSSAYLKATRGLHARGQGLRRAPGQGEGGRRRLHQHGAAGHREGAELQPDRPQRVGRHDLPVPAVDDRHGGHAGGRRRSREDAGLVPRRGQRARRRQLLLVRPLLQLPGVLHQPAAASAGLRARQHGRPRPDGDVRRRHPGEEPGALRPGHEDGAHRGDRRVSRRRSRPRRPTSRAASPRSRACCRA